MQTIKLDALTLRVSSELMENYVAGTPVDVQADLRVAHDTRGEPILFWLDKAPPSILCAAVRSPTSRTGWRRCALTDATHGHIEAFDVHQLPDGSLTVVCIARHCDGVTLAPPKLWASGPSSNDPASAHWDGAAAERWVECGEIRESAYPDVVRFGAGPIAAVSAPNARDLHLVRLEGDRWSASRFDVPSGVEEPRHLAAGTLHGAHGVFVLRTDASAGQVLEFTPLLDPGERRAFTLPEKASSLTAVAPPSGGEPDVYVGGTGVYVFSGGRADAPVEVIAPGSAQKIHRLHIVQDPGTTAVFAIADLACRVLHTERVGSQPWSKPLQIWNSAYNVAAMRGVGANALFAQASGAPIHYFQDARTKLWKSVPVLVPSPEPERFMTYTTRIVVADEETKLPAIAQKLELCAVSRTYLYANGQLQLVDPVHPALVETDVTGALTLALPIDDLSSPTLYIRSPGGTTFRSDRPRASSRSSPTPNSSPRSVSSRSGTRR